MGDLPCLGLPALASAFAAAPPDDSTSRPVTIPVPGPPASLTLPDRLWAPRQSRDSSRCPSPPERPGFPGVLGAQPGSVVLLVRSHLYLSVIQSRSCPVELQGGPRPLRSRLPRPPSEGQVELGLRLLSVCPHHPLAK